MANMEMLREELQVHGVHEGPAHSAHQDCQEAKPKPLFVLLGVPADEILE